MCFKGVLNARHYSALVKRKLISHPSRALCKAVPLGRYERDHRDYERFLVSKERVLAGLCSTSKRRLSYHSTI